MKFKGTKIITPYSTYLLSKYSNKVAEIVVCECCEVKFATNIGKKRCSHICAKKARKNNQKSNNNLTK